MEKEEALKYLINLRWIIMISAQPVIPIQILLWYLNYQTAFWIVLVLEILGSFVAMSQVNKLEKILEF